MPILEQDILKKSIGDALYKQLDDISDREVGEARALILLDKYGQKKYFHSKLSLTDILAESREFERRGLKISPWEVVRILFKCKMLFVSQTEEEYYQRVGGGMLTLNIWWSDRSKKFEDLVSEQLAKLNSTIEERTLLATIDYFNCPKGMGDPDKFFKGVFEKLGLPFSSYLVNRKLVSKHKKLEPNLKSYSLSSAKKFFTAPSIGFTVVGSEGYAYFYSSAQLRALLNMLRVAGFIYRPQIDFGQKGIDITAPVSPVFMGSGSLGGYSWDEDSKRPWEKIPDGNLFQSFGYRGLSKMYLDNRCFKPVEDFIIDNSIIFSFLKDPHGKNNVEDIEPALDILSSVTFIPDLGAKLLLSYCCLEHLFVPKDIKNDNTKYIIGAINALKPDLLPWFQRLYKERCEYAHKGYILKDDKTRGLIFESVKNIFILLIAKLRLNQ